MEVYRTPEGLYLAKGVLHQILGTSLVDAVGKLTLREGDVKLRIEGIVLEPSEMDKGQKELYESILQAEAELAEAKDDYSALQAMGKLDHLMFEWLQQYPDVQFKR